VSGVQRGAPRRAWGWHPLGPDWARRVVEASLVRPGDLVVDLGAGTGALTDPLVELGARVIAVELHPGRAQGLRDRYGAAVRVLQLDITAFRPPRDPFRVVANPPYLRSTHLVHELLKSDRLLSADLVLQRGVIRRFADRPPPGRQKRRFTLTEGMRLPRKAFVRPSQVDSSILQIRRR
jgi:23S rRNA (adenine-N6)-dimethyltransferase